MNNILEKINTVFVENGLLVDDYQAPLIDYIPESITFINIVIGIEEILDIELPDAFLSIQNLGNTMNLAERLKDLVDDL